MKQSKLNVMKTTISFGIIISILLCYCTSQGEKNAKKFTLEGEISGQDSGIIVLRYVPYSKAIYDTANIYDGKFIFKGDIIEPTKASLIGGDDLNTVDIYLEKGRIKIILEKDKYKECKMYGSKSQLELNLLNDIEKPINEKLQQLRNQRNDLTDSINNTSNDSIKNHLNLLAEEIDQQWFTVRESLNLAWLQFVIDHPKSYVTPYYLNMLESNEVLSLDSLKKIYNRLDVSIQNSKYGKYIKDDIRKKDNISIGAKAPDFKAIDINQDTITLNQFEDKDIVLIDFWASWCKPCREEIPYLKTLYNKYHEQGFEIISVTLDMNLNAWRNAINQEKIDIWYNIPVAKNFAAGPSNMTEEDIYSNYFVQAIPSKILIDKNGVIIGRWGGGLKEPETTLEDKLEQIFKN